MEFNRDTWAVCIINELRKRIEHNACYKMLYVWILKAILHVGSKFGEFVLREVERGQKFVEHHLVDETSNERILATFPHCIQSAEIADRRKDSVRTIQKRNLALVVRSLRRYKLDIQSGFVGGKLGGKRFGGFYHPKMIHLAHNQLIVIKANTRLDDIGVVLRETRHDTVNER